MQTPFYEIIRTEKDFSTFRFMSSGKKEIIKIVEFQKTTKAGVYNLAMGDRIEDLRFSDQSISDNGDIRKVLTTVVNIVQIYTKRHPGRSVFIIGNTNTKTNVYQRIIRMYYSAFTNEFDIWGYISDDEKETFNIKKDYIAFIVKRKK